MSDNVVPLFGDQPQKKHLSFRKQWIIFITIVVLIFVVLFWYLLSQTTALDGVKRFFGASENDYRDIGFTLYGQSDFALVGESFAVVSQSGLQVFDVDGQMLLELSDSLMKPAVITSEGYGLMYDLGGTRAVLFDADGEILFDKRMPGRIFDASLCQEGLCALLYEGENCFTAFEVYDEEGEKRYAHHSSSAFLNTCALSPDGDNAVVGTLGQQDISFLSTARVLKPHSEASRRPIPSERSWYVRSDFWARRKSLPSERKRYSFLTSRAKNRPSTRSRGEASGVLPCVRSCCSCSTRPRTRTAVVRSCALMAREMCSAPSRLRRRRGS